MLSIPFRRTAAVSMAAPIKQYISNKYDQHPSMFADDCVAIDNTRTAAVQVTDAHVSGIKKLEAYAAQLVWMTAKFPVDVRVFVWRGQADHRRLESSSRGILRWGTTRRGRVRTVHRPDRG
jgi:programmed cell death 6-interacting protein